MTPKHPSARGSNTQTVLDTLAQDIDTGVTFAPDKGTTASRTGGSYSADLIGYVEIVAQNA